MSDLERVSITIDKALLRRFDELISVGGVSNRSEAFRDLIRARLVREVWRDENRQVVASVTIVYDQTKRGVVEQLVSTSHLHHAMVLSTMHVYLDAANALEVTALRGSVGDVRKLAEQLVGMKGVQHGQVVLCALPE